ncbi:MAG: TraR/DksA C4-type zinc finger protein [Chloroflexi bacterium]|nr:TraR/DksA C4-type zinc finger protein [Chloroflexota bacterium]
MVNTWKAPAKHDVNAQVTRAKLEAERAAHVQELEKLRATLLELPEMSAEEGDPAVAERAQTLGMIEQIENQITEVERTLATLRRGGYGICEQCGKPIDAERLQILPETRLCVKCKSQLEKKTHHRTW